MLAVLALVVGMGLALGVGFSQPHGLWMVMAIVVAILSVVGYALAPETAILTLVVIRPVVDVYVYRFTFAGLHAGMLWAGLVVAFCALYLLTHASSLRRIASRYAIPLLFLALLVAFTLTRPGWVSAATDALKVGAWLVLSAAVAAMASRQQGRAKVLRFMGYAAIVTAATMVILVLQGRFGAGYYGRALTEADAGPHGLAFAGVTVLPFVLLAILIERKIAIPLVTTVALSVGIVLSYVRSAYLGFAVIMLVFTVIASKATRLRTKLTGVGFWALVLVVGYYVQDALVPRFLDLLGRNPESMPSSAGGGRNLIWSAVMEQSLATPYRTLLGNGAEASTQYIVDARLPPLWAHSDPLEMLASGGVVLLCGYLALLWWMGRAAVGVARVDPADPASRSLGLLAFAAVVGFFLMSVTNGVVYSLPETNFMGVLMGVCYGLLADRAAEPKTTSHDVARGYSRRRRV